MRSKSESLLTKVISGSLLASVVAVAASTAVSAAEEGPTASDVQAVLDNVWILIAAVLVIFMHSVGEIIVMCVLAFSPKFPRCSCV